MEQWKVELRKICEAAVTRKGRLTIKEFQEDYGKENVNKFVTRWFICEYLNWDKDQVCKNLTRDVFRTNRLAGFLFHQYGDSVYAAVSEAFPGEYLPWELNKVYTNCWNKENAIKAIRWWIEEEQKWTMEIICTKFSKSQMMKKKSPYGGKIYWLIKRIFDGETINALEAIYPGKFMQVNGKITLKNQ